MNTKLGMWLGMAASAVLTVAGAGGVAMAASQPADKDKKAAPASMKDVLILKTGQRVEGQIIEETETTIRFKVVAAGGISAERTYNRSEVLSIERAAHSPSAPATPEKPATKTPAAPPVPPSPAKAGVADAGAARIYLVELGGEFGRDVALTPMKRVVEDARKNEPDVLVVKIDCEYKIMGEEQKDFEADPTVYGQLETARQIAVMLTDEIDADPKWTKKPRLVFWVKKALGAVAFVPFVGREIYYTNDARHGGIGNLDRLFEGVGDEVAREKQRSLRLGRAAGLANKGGHDERILEAMARTDYVLSYSFEGGQIVLHEDRSGEHLLTDSGEDSEKDDIKDVVRYKGNDVLTLDAQTANTLGMAAGLVDTETELVTALGFERNYKEADGKGTDILKSWGKEVSEAEFNIRRLWRELERVAPDGNDQNQQNAQIRALSRRKAILEDIKALLVKYGESINPREIGGPVADMITDINLRVELIEQEIRRLRRR
jgi:hypothetical protein